MATETYLSVVSKESHYVLQAENNVGADQIVHMSKLICTSVFAYNRNRFYAIWFKQKGICILILLFDFLFNP